MYSERSTPKILVSYLKNCPLESKTGKVFGRPVAVRDYLIGNFRIFSFSRARAGQLPPAPLVATLLVVIVYDCLFSLVLAVSIPRRR